MCARTLRAFKRKVNQYKQLRQVRKKKKTYTRNIYSNAQVRWWIMWPHTHTHAYMNHQIIFCRRQTFAIRMVCVVAGRLAEAIENARLVIHATMQCFRIYFTYLFWLYTAVRAFGCTVRSNYKVKHSHEFVYKILQTYLQPRPRSSRCYYCCWWIHFFFLFIFRWYTRALLPFDAVKSNWSRMLQRVRDKMVNS